MHFRENWPGCRTRPQPALRVPRTAPAALPVSCWTVRNSLRPPSRVKAERTRIVRSRPALPPPAGPQRPALGVLLKATAGTTVDYRYRVHGPRAGAKRRLILDLARRRVLTPLARTRRGSRRGGLCRRGRHPESKLRQPEKRPMKPHAINDRHRGATSLGPSRARAPDARGEPKTSRRAAPPGNDSATSTLPPTHAFQRAARSQRRSDHRPAGRIVLRMGPKAQRSGILRCGARDGTYATPESDHQCADHRGVERHHRACVSAGSIYVAATGHGDAQTRKLQPSTRTLREPARGTPAMKLPEPARTLWTRHREAIERIATTPGAESQIMLGGGTLLAARWKHRGKHGHRRAPARPRQPERRARKRAVGPGCRHRRRTQGEQAATDSGWSCRPECWTWPAIRPQMPGLEEQLDVEGRNETVLASAQILRGKFYRTDKSITRDAFDFRPSPPTRIRAPSSWPSTAWT